MFVNINDAVNRTEWLLFVVSLFTTSTKRTTFGYGLIISIRCLEVNIQQTFNQLPVRPTAEKETNALQKENLKIKPFVSVNAKFIILYILCLAV